MSQHINDQPAAATTLADNPSSSHALIQDTCQILSKNLGVWN